MKNKEDILAKWLSGEISDGELESLEGTDALQELKKVTQEVDQWSLPKYNTDAGYQELKERLSNQTPNETPNRTLKQTTNKTPEKSPKKEGSKWPRIIVALGIIGILLYGFISFLGNKAEELKAESGEHINYAFQDGTEVWLNDGSRIQYKTSDWSTERKIELEGEALFEVSKGSPFTVNTPNGTVTVLGTQFNVRAWGNNLYVECYEGKVQVQYGDQRTIIVAQEAVNIIDGSMNAKQVINNTSPLWQNGLSRFYNDKLKVVCDEIERQYEISVDLRAADRNFSGNFRHDDLDNALRSICIPLKLNYTIGQDKKSVVIE